MKAAVEALGARLEFQLAPSPDIKPIELDWSKLKGLLKGAKGRTIDALNQAIAEAVALIDFHNNAAAWF